MSAIGSTPTSTIITAKWPACSVTFLITTLITSVSSVWSRVLPATQDISHLTRQSTRVRWFPSFLMVPTMLLYVVPTTYVLPWSHNSEVILVHFAISRLAECEQDAIPRKMMRLFSKKEFRFMPRQRAFK